MSKTRFLLLFIPAFLIALIFTAPARLVLPLLPPASQELSWAEPQGRIISGELPWLQWQEQRIGPLQWRLAPIPAISGTPLSLSLEQPAAIQLNVGGDQQQLKISNGELKAELATVLQQMLGNSMGLDANIRIDNIESVWTQGKCESLSGQAAIDQWRGMDGFETIGEITAELACAPNRIWLDVNADNNIKLRGRIGVDIQGRYRIDLRANPPAGPLRQNLEALLGKPRGSEFIIQQRG